MCSLTPWLRPVPAAAATAAAQARSSSAKPTCTSAACLLPPQTSIWSNCVTSEYANTVIMLLWMCEICWCWKRGTKSQLQLYFPCMCAICKTTQLYGNADTRLSQMSSSNNPDVYVLTRVSPLAPKLMHPFIISPTKFKSVPTVWSLSFRVAALQFGPRLQPLRSADQGLVKEQLLPCETEADWAFLWLCSFPLEWLPFANYIYWAFWKLFKHISSDFNDNRGRNYLGRNGMSVCVSTSLSANVGLNIRLSRSI